jgi:adenylosuccinate lyase
MMNDRKIPLGYSDKQLNQVGNLSPEQLQEERFAMRSMSVYDGKYRKKIAPLMDCLSEEAYDWRAIAEVQHAMIKTQHEFGIVGEEIVEDSRQALKKFDPVNAKYIEANVTNHDIVAVILDLSRHCELETPTHYHKGTTSYDALDTGRAALLKKVYKQFFRPAACDLMKEFTRISKHAEDENLIRVGRTHLQDTSPVPFAMVFASYGRQVAENIEELDYFFSKLKGKISGMTGTGAGVEKATKVNQFDYEKMLLEKLDLIPDMTATQVTNKSVLASIGHGMTNLTYTIVDFANDVRIYYSSAIKEMTTSDNAASLGLSSTSAAKNNPINFENVVGTARLVEGGMGILYQTKISNIDRDLCNSKPLREEPRSMICKTYEAVTRLTGRLKKLALIKDNIEKNLTEYRRLPDEAMVCILKGEEFTHSKYGLPHSFVKEMAKSVKTDKTKKLIDQCLKDDEFKTCYENMSNENQRILQGEVELYIGNAYERARINRDFIEGIMATKI